MSSILQISKENLQIAIEEIKKAGEEKREGFVLFLGDLRKKPWIIQKAYIPQYKSGPFYYEITEEGDQALTHYLLDNHLMVVAQLHSHPEDAFHSKADDKMATVGHIGGLSFVLPNFGERATIESFSSLAKCYQLQRGGAWIEVETKIWEVI